MRNRDLILRYIVGIILGFMCGFIVGEFLKKEFFGEVILGDAGCDDTECVKEEQCDIYHHYPNIRFIFDPNLVITEEIGMPVEIIKKVLTDSSYVHWLDNVEISGFTFHDVPLSYDMKNVTNKDIKPIDYIDTPFPVCPFCGEINNYHGYISQNAVNDLKDAWLNINEYFKDNYEFYQCDKCNRFFYINEHRMTYKQNGISFTSDDVYYTTAKVITGDKR